MKINSRLLIVSALVAGLQAASAADITGTVTLNGTPPPEAVNNLIKSDPYCGPLHPETVTTHFYVVGSKGELADAVVTIKELSTGKSTGDSAPPFMVDQKGCEYIPSIGAVQTNQKITVKNSDNTLHNVHVTPKAPGNTEKNQAQMAGAPDITFTFPSAEKFLRFKCDVHPWMFAWITVVDSPYFAVTDKDGAFKISNVPPGKYTVEVAHRKAGTTSKEIEVTDAGAKVDFTLNAPAPK